MQRLLLGLSRRAVRLYYRVKRLGGDVPSRGPVILVGNHPNGLVDPVLIAGTTDRPVRLLGKATLFELPLLGQVVRGLEVLPVYRAQDGADTSANARTFDAVYAALARGELVCLFPEGKSHGDPALATLKTGAARMALGAEERLRWELGVVIVPVGLVYRDKERFRSRVAVWTGAPIAVAPLRAAYERDPRAAVHELTEAIAAGLRSVTLELEHWEDLPLLELAERILFSERAGRIERQRRFAMALRELRAREPERVADLARRIAAFGERLGRLGLEPHDLPERLALPYRAGPVARFTLHALLVLAVGLPLAAVGAVLWWIPYRLSGALPVRFTTPDTRATGRILAAFVALPLWWLGLVVAAGMRLGAPAAVATALATPPLGLVALRFRDWRVTALDEIRLFLRLVSRRRLAELLLAERAGLARELDALRSQLHAL